MQIIRVPRPPARDAAPHPLVMAVTEIDRLVLTDEYGHADFTDPPQALTVALFGHEYSRRVVFVALPDWVDPDTCPPTSALGHASASLPLKEDTALAMVNVATRPDQRGRGVGRALWEALVPVLHAEGRATWMAWTFNPGPPSTGRDAIEARSGSGAIDGTRPGNRWCVAEGFTLEQCERPSTLVLDEELLAKITILQARAAAVAGPDHELLSWSDATPPELREGLGWLISRMSTDVPMADLAFEEEVWDAARVVDSEDRMRTAGMHWVLSAARHVPTGDLAGFTRFMWPGHNPAGVWQEETLVLSAHRGKNLGMLVKAANVARLLEVNPQARRAHTWNASENRWMLAINDALGFVPVGLEGSWQKRL